MLNIKELVSSKKFKVAIFSVLSLVCAVLAEKLTITQGLESTVMIVMAYLGAQGLADFGKAKSVDTSKDTSE